MNKSSGVSSAVKAFIWCGGTFLIILCGGLIVTYIGEIIQGTTKHGVASQLGLITFLAGLVFVGLKLIQSQLRERNALRQINEEQLILSRAKTKGGSLTVSDAALECKLGISDTKKAFERLALTGVCRVDVNDAGELFYWFPTFEKSKQVQSGGLLSEDATITLPQSEKNPS